jgi:hypothetical protein
MVEQFALPEGRRKKRVGKISTRSWGTPVTLIALNRYTGLLFISGTCNCSLQVKEGKLPNTLIRLLQMIPKNGILPGELDLLQDSFVSPEKESR